MRHVLVSPCTGDCELDSVLVHLSQEIQSINQIALSRPVGPVTTVKWSKPHVTSYRDLNASKRTLGAAAAKLIGIPPEALAGAEVEAFGTDLREEQLTEVGVLMREDDLISKDADVSGLLP